MATVTERLARLLERDAPAWGIRPVPDERRRLADGIDELSPVQQLRPDQVAALKTELARLSGPLAALRLDGIDWAIVGGESGPGARPMAKEWVLDIRDQCQQNGVAFFFKQWGGVNKKKTGRLLEGRTWDELPDRKPSIQPALERFE